MFLIGQCNRTVKGTVNTSCLCKSIECVMDCCLAFRRVNCCLQPQPMSSFFLKFCYDQTELDSARSYLAADDQWRSKFYYCVSCMSYIVVCLVVNSRLAQKEHSIQSCGRLIERRRKNSPTETSLIRIFLAYIYIVIVVWVFIVVIHFVVVVMGVVVFAAVMVVVVAVVVVVGLMCVVLVTSRLISNSPRFTSCLWVTQLKILSLYRAHFIFGLFLSLSDGFSPSCRTFSSSTT